MEYQIDIVDGSGTANIPNGSYGVDAEVNGYDNNSITPSSVSISEETYTYAFTIAATGTLTLHVSEDGESGSTPVVGAVFVRTDSLGNEYGTEIVSDASGNAIFSNVPYSTTSAPNIYFKQKSTAAGHEYSSDVQSIQMTSSTYINEIQNELSPSRTLTLTDSNYDNLPLELGTINLTE